MKIDDKLIDFFKKYGGYRFISKRGMRMHPLKKVMKYHAGYDLALADRAPIKAFVGGTVVFAAPAGDMGICVIIKSADGAGHVYGHLHDEVVSVGQLVKAGDVIGKQGNTGASAGSHLHYEIRKTCSAPAFGYDKDDREGSTIEPYDYLVKSLAPKLAPSKPADPKPVKVVQKQYTVRWGDSLSEIADKYGTTVSAIVKLNKVKDADEIKVGQVIKLP